MPTVFLSSVTSELSGYRSRLAQQLLALPGEPVTVVMQDDFRQGDDTLLAHLADLVSSSDVVVHIVGDGMGYVPTETHVRALYTHLGEAPPDVLPVRSVTQWEYHLAKRFRKRTLTYLLAPDAPRLSPLPDAPPQTDDDRDRQQAHRAAIEADGEHYTVVHHPIGLTQEVVRDLGYEDLGRIDNLPFKPLGSLFKGRDAFLDTIRTTLGQIEARGGVQRAAAITAAAPVASVHGLGGIGKTRAAIEYAHRYRDEYTALLFVRADTPGALHQNLADLVGATVLNLPDPEGEPEKRLASVLGWLNSHPGWFLIVDNVDSPEAAIAVQEMLARLAGAGQVLITSRLSAWETGVEPLELDLLAADDAADFLLAATEARRVHADDDHEQAIVLAERLGRLALALEQAAAYIRTMRVSFAAYLALWEAGESVVRGWYDKRQMQYSVELSVAKTWYASFDQLSADAQLLLDVVSWLAPDPIPESLLDATERPAQLLVALAEVEGLSLAQRTVDADPRTFTVHRLVQEVTRQRLDEAEQQATFGHALDWVSGGFQQDTEDVSAWTTLKWMAPHAAAILSETARLPTERVVIQMLDRLGKWDRQTGQLRSARRLLERQTEMERRLSGDDHPNLAVSYSNLAVLQQALGDLPEARRLLEDAIRITTLHFDPDHPNVATLSSNLALVVQDLGDLPAARRLLEDAIRIEQKHFHPDHPTLATSYSNLSGVVRAQGDLPAARRLLEDAIRITTLHFDPDHPNVATLSSNLALVVQALGDLPAARRLLEDAIRIEQKHFHPDHPTLATSYSNLSGVVRAQGDLPEARRLLEDAIRIDQKHFHPDHPTLAISYVNLGVVLWDIGERDEAARLMKTAFAIFLHRLGAEHPNVNSPWGYLHEYDPAWVAGVEAGEVDPLEFLPRPS